MGLESYQTLHSTALSHPQFHHSFRIPRVSKLLAMLQQDQLPKHSPKLRVPHVLTVAGSDSGAGAGIQADLKACSARGVYCSTVITALTAQNTVGVQGVDVVAEDFVREQLNSVLSDMHPDVVKTGMLPSSGIIKVLCQSLKQFQVRALVVDPVMVSTSGDVLAPPLILASLRTRIAADWQDAVAIGQQQMDSSLVKTMSLCLLHVNALIELGNNQGGVDLFHGYYCLDELLPLADVVTPNLREASALLGGVPLETVADMRSAAKLIHDIGPRNVLVKGGDLPASSDAVDVLFDGKEFYEFRSPRIKTTNTHGTGCTLASSIAAELAKGSSVPSAIKIAKRYIDSALEYSKDILIGGGNQGPFDHVMKLKNVAHHPFDPSELLLYAVTDSRMNKKWGRSISDAVKDAVEGGATIIQLREKDTDTGDFLEAAKSCVEICRRYGVHLLINDRIDIAIACDADGVHIGQSDMPASVARALLGPDKIIGVSCKTVEQAEKAWMDGADYIGCGGVYPTNTKENNVRVGLEGLRRVSLASKLPVVGIGGIGISNVKSVMELGVPNLKGVAVVSALFDRECVFSETQNLLRLIMDSIK